MGKYWPWVIGTAGYVFFLRPQLLKWGTRLGESQRLLPGDEVVPQASAQITHACNIDAPPQAVWPWLTQMGRERTGYYGLDLLTNKGLPSVSFVRQDIAPPAVGMAMDGGYQIVTLEAERLLVFGVKRLRDLTGVEHDVSMTYLLERRRDGSTRILARRRSYSYSVLGRVADFVNEPIYIALLYQQLGRIKQYAEGMAHLRAH